LSLGLFFLFFLFGLRVWLFGDIKLEPESVIATEVVIVHPSGLKEAKLGIKIECSHVDTFSLEHDFINIILNPFIKLIKEFLSDLEPAILLQHNQHCDVGFPGVGGVVVADDTSDELVFEVGHDGELGPVGEEVVVGVD
jgi:hypothetical protein